MRVEQLTQLVLGLEELGGCNQPNSSPGFAGSGLRQELAELFLQRHRHLIEVLQEDRPFRWQDLEARRPRGIRKPGAKREDLVLSAAINRDQKALAPRAMVMDSARDQLFARAGLAHQQHGCI